MKSITNPFGFGLLSIAGGACLATVIASFLFDTPLMLWHTFDLMLAIASGHTSAAPGGMSAIGLTCLVVTSIFSVAIVLWLIGAIAQGARERSAPLHAAWALAETPVPVWNRQTRQRANRLR